jgi:aryl-alcohol dehydrogenase-like predicted oxidoreductase
MKFAAGPAPILGRVRAMFGEAATTGWCTYGDTVYRLDGKPMPPEIRAHEELHAEQQRVMGPMQWWDQWLIDVTFRLEQEVAAYARQYDFVRRQTSSKRLHRAELNGIAVVLSSSLYGGVITKAEARARILAATKSGSALPK